MGGGGIVTADIGLNIQPRTIPYNSEYDLNFKVKRGREETKQTTINGQINVNAFNCFINVNSFQRLHKRELFSMAS